MIINVYKELKPTLIIIGVLCIVTIFVQYFYSGSLNLNDLSQAFLYNVYYGLPLSLVNGYFFDFLNKAIPWEKSARTRAIIGVIGSISLTMITLIFLNMILWVFFFGEDYSALWNVENRDFYMIALVITIIVSTTIHAITFFKGIENEKEISQKLREEKLASELNALRSHVDPHFLFNSFNVLSGLIDEDADKAQDFLSGLSKIYRYILEQRNEETCTVENELEFAERYIQLQKMRFEKSIEVNTQINDAVKQKHIPSLSLQLLLENAIKHNRFSNEDPLIINISADNGTLSVSNNRQHRKNIKNSSGMGLQNISDRYSLLMDKEIEIDSANDYFTVKLPLI